MVEVGIDKPFETVLMKLAWIYTLTTCRLNYIQNQTNNNSLHQRKEWIGLTKNKKNENIYIYIYSTTLKKMLDIHNIPNNEVMLKNFGVQPRSP